MKLKYETCGDFVLEVFPSWDETIHWTCAETPVDNVFNIVEFRKGALEGNILETFTPLSYESRTDCWERACLRLHMIAVTDWQMTIERRARWSEFTRLMESMAEAMERFTHWHDCQFDMKPEELNDSHLQDLHKALNRLGEAEELFDDVYTSNGG